MVGVFEGIKDPFLLQQAVVSRVAEQGINSAMGHMGTGMLRAEKRQLYQNVQP